MIVNYSHRFVSDIILSTHASNIKLKNNQSACKKITLYNTIYNFGHTIFYKNVSRQSISYIDI